MFWFQFHRTNLLLIADFHFRQTKNHLSYAEFGLSLEKDLQITIVLWLITWVILSFSDGETVIDMCQVKLNMNYLLWKWKNNWHRMQNLKLFFIFFPLCRAQWQQWGVKLSPEKPPGPRVRPGEGTYNPKSAWKFVDSRRRVLPDIDGKNWLDCCLTQFLYFCF